MSKKNFIWILILFLPGFLPGESRGETYFFVDKEGVVHFTDNPSDSRFRRHERDSAYVRVDREALNRMIVSASRRHAVETALVKAVVKVESDFDPQAVSAAGAMGLMQLMPATARLMGVDNPFDPFENLSGGTRLLRGLLDRFKNDMTLALAAYHAGPRRVEEHGGVPPIEQTHRYIRKVLSAYATYQAAVSGSSATFRVDSANGDIIYTNIPENYRDSERFRLSYGK